MVACTSPWVAWLQCNASGCTPPRRVGWLHGSIAVMVHSTTAGRMVAWLRGCDLAANLSDRCARPHKKYPAIQPLIITSPGWNWLKKKQRDWCLSASCRPLETPRTITALSYRGVWWGPLIGSLLCRGTSVFRADNWILPSETYTELPDRLGPLGSIRPPLRAPLKPALTDRNKVQGCVRGDPSIGPPICL